LSGAQPSRLWGDQASRLICVDHPGRRDARLPRRQRCLRPNPAQPLAFFASSC